VPQRPLPDATRVGVVAGTELSLSLDDAIEMALKNNNDIGVSRAGTKTSNLDLLGVKGAYDPLVASTNFYESVSVPTASAIGGAVNGSVTTTRTSNNISIDGLVPLGGASYSAVFNSSRNTTSNTNSFLNPQFPSSLNFSYTQPLRRNRSIDAARRNIQIAKKNIEISETQLQTEAMNVVNTVEQAYWDLVYAMRSIEVQTDTLKQARAQLESNSRMVEKGVLAPIEIVAARAQIAYDQYSAVLRRAELQIASEVRTAARAVETNFKRVATTRSARTLQVRRLDAEEKKFAAGMSTNFLVTQAQRDLALAEVAELRAISDYNKSIVDFERVQESGLSGGNGLITVR